MALFQGRDRGAHVLMHGWAGHEDLLHEPVDLSNQLMISNVCTENIELEVVHLYTVRNESNKTQKKQSHSFIK